MNRTLALEFDSAAFQELIIGMIEAILNIGMNMIITLLWTDIFLGTLIPFFTGSEDFMGVDNVTLILFIGFCFGLWFFLRKFP